MIDNICNTIYAMYHNAKRHIEESRMQHAKLGVTYSVFNGEELLRASILSIRKHVDYINVVYQKFSWFGTPSNENLERILFELKEEGLIDSVIEYPFSDFGNKEKVEKYVLDKKNVGIADLRANKCTHCLIMDADEFYFADEFQNAKQYVIARGITHSACSIYDYRYLPEIRNRDAAKYAVPFIFKIKRTSKLSDRHHMPCFVDSLRTFSFNRFFDKFYYFNTVCMHHMTGIRTNYLEKIEASVSNCTEEGKKHLSHERDRIEKEIIMSKENLLTIKNEWGGYIDVGDLFELREYFQKHKNR